MQSKRRGTRGGRRTLIYSRVLQSQCQQHPWGLWRSWERASMAWKRSRVRIPSGPPQRFQRLSLPMPSTTQGCGVQVESKLKYHVGIARPDQSSLSIASRPRCCFCTERRTRRHLATTLLIWRKLSGERTRIMNSSATRPQGTGSLGKTRSTPISRRCDSSRPT